MRMKQFILAAFLSNVLPAGPDAGQVPGWPASPGGARKRQSAQEARVTRTTRQAPPEQLLQLETIQQTDKLIPQ